MADKSNILYTSDQKFVTDVVESPDLTVVDFWAEWCAPCRILAVTLEEVAKEFAGKLRIVKMNVDENQQVPAQFHIRSIPTMIFFKGGKQVDQMIGNYPKEAIRSTVEKHLKD